MDNKITKPKETPLSNHEACIDGISRRDFVKCSAGTVAGIYFGSFITDHTAPGGDSPTGYKIDSNVYTTLQRVISFPLPAQANGPNSGKGLYLTELMQIADYRKYGYGIYSFAGGLPCVPRI